jgi:cytochrome oxidase Cu insertion factor (SCO1/SenC/PrrC family)
MTSLLHTAALAAALALALAAPGAAAHADHSAHNKAPAASGPVSAPPAAKAAASLSADARTYFTDLELLTQDGKPVKFYTDLLEGKTVVINVIYTNCKDACPMITAQILQVRKALGEDANRMQFISISSDPKRDTPAALKAFMKKNQANLPNWTFVTGKKENIDHILKKLGQFNENVEDHSTLLIAGNVPAKRWAKIQANFPAPTIAERLRIVVNQAPATDGKAQ